MAKIITSIIIEYKKKLGVYEITMNHKDGQWEGSSRGAKLIPTDGYLIYTSWGSGMPLKVFKNIYEAEDYFLRTYTCSVEIV